MTKLLDHHAHQPVLFKETEKLNLLKWCKLEIHLAISELRNTKITLSFVLCTYCYNIFERFLKFNFNETR